MPGLVLPRVELNAIGQIVPVFSRAKEAQGPCACGLSLSIALESHVGGGEREEGEHGTQASTLST